jgi:outer membrane beta-barrel protein
MLLSSVAVAQRKNPLKGQPAVRRRVLYLPGRFEVAPSMGMTFLQDFKHAVMFGIKAEYHIPWCFGAKHFKECLSVGASFHGSAPQLAWDTELTREIKDTLSTEFDEPEINPAPTKKCLDDAVSHLSFAAVAPYITYTPWLGKMSLLGQVFFDFDFYVMFGLGITYFKAGNIKKYEDILRLDVQDKNGGVRFGPAFGVGARFYILKWLAVHIDWRDIYLSQAVGQGRNSAGFDKNGSLNANGEIVIDKKDRVSEHVMYITVGASFFFPLDAPRSE